MEDGCVYQQVDGRADISVSGHIEGLEETANGSVYAQLLRECDRTLVTPWIRCDTDKARYGGVLRGIRAGGPYQLHVKYSRDDDPEWEINGDVRFHLGVGDLWLIAGQSNAVGYGKTPVVDPADPNVHLFGLTRRWRDATEPLSEGFSPMTEGYVTGACPFTSFGSALTRELGYPIGLIQAALGGTPLKAWRKGEGLYRNLLDAVGQVGGRMKGVLWYQGCTDAGTWEDAQAYSERFARFVSDLRGDLNAPELPLLTVQLNKTLPLGDESVSGRWALVKEAQRQAARSLPKVYVTSSSDLGLSDWVHNSGQANVTLGQRLGWLALDKVYARQYMGLSPDVSEITQSGAEACIRFASVYERLVACIPPKDDFLFEDDEGELPHGECRVEGDRIFTRLTRAPKGELFCSFAPFNLNSGLLPFDRATGMPPLSFYRVRVRAESGGRL